MICARSSSGVSMCTLVLVGSSKASKLGTEAEEEGGLVERILYQLEPASSQSVFVRLYQ
jgi:hypothetical protein